MHLIFIGARSELCLIGFCTTCIMLSSSCTARDENLTISSCTYNDCIIVYNSRSLCRCQVLDHCRGGAILWEHLRLQRLRLSFPGTRSWWDSSPASNRRDPDKMSGGEAWASSQDHGSCGRTSKTRVCCGRTSKSRMAFMQTPPWPHTLTEHVNTFYAILRCYFYM